ncbi:MAG: alpha/beta hydrolase [Cytophagales bacterium]|nr:alpha/beta hydrolase [Armatimonadota bacterium]
MKHSHSKIQTRGGVSLHMTVYEAETDSAPGATREMLLLHGWPNAGRIWEPLAQALTLADPRLRCFAPDLRGYGDSDRPESGYHCETFADDVLDTAAALGLKRYTLLGHSMSGKIAQIVASRQPPELCTLVLVTPGLLAASPPVDIAGRKAIYGDASQVRDLVVGWAAHPLPAASADLLVEDALRMDRAAWNGWLAPMRDEDFFRDAARITVPTLVVGGGKDPQRMEEELRRGVVAQIRGAEYARLPGSGHLPHLEEPDALAALIVNFLDRLPGGERVSP